MHAGDLGKADIAFHVAILVVDLLEIVHIEDDEHLAAAAHLRRAIEIAVLIQKARERVELVPHLAAIDEIQHRKQRDAQPCHVQLRQRDLDDRLRRQKDDERIDQYAAAILEHTRRDGRTGRKINKRGKVRRDVKREKVAARIEILFAHGEHHPPGSISASEMRYAASHATAVLNPRRTPCFLSSTYTRQSDTAGDRPKPR